MTAALGAALDLGTMPEVCYQLPDFAPAQPVVGLVHVRDTTPALLVILKTSLVVGDSTSSS